MSFIPLPEGGIRVGTSKNIPLDAGVVFKNICLDKLINPTPGQEWNAWNLAKTTSWTNYNGIQVPAKIGATRGGVSFNPGRSERQIEVDGRRTYIVGYQRIDMLEPTIKINLLEGRDPETQSYYLGSGTSEHLGAYTRIQSLLYVREEEYLGNIVVAQFVGGSPLPILYVINNARANTAEETQTTDKNETVLPVTFMGHTTEDDIYGELLSPGEVWVPDLLVS